MDRFNTDSRMSCRSEGRGWVSSLPTGLVTVWGWQCCTSHGQQHDWGTRLTRIFIRVMNTWSRYSKSSVTQTHGWNHWSADYYGNFGLRIFSDSKILILLVFLSFFLNFSKNMIQTRKCCTLSEAAQQRDPTPTPSDNDPWSSTTFFHVNPMMALYFVSI